MLPSPVRSISGLFVAGVLLLAGCASPDTPALQPGALIIPADVLQLTPDVQLPGDGFGAEPNIAALADGTLFVIAPSDGSFLPSARDGAAYLWRSTDHGASWTALRTPTPLETPVGPTSLWYSGDSDVVTSSDGWVYYSDWWIGPPYLAGGNYNVVASGDGGNTWTSAPITTIDAFYGVDRQWLVAGEGGHVVLVYAYYHPVRNAIDTVADVPARGDYRMSLNAVVSEDHGATWSMPIAVTLPIAGHQMLHGKTVLLQDGTLVVPYVDTTNRYLSDPGVVRVAISKDGGYSWAQREVATIKQAAEAVWPVQAAVDDGGKLYVVWNERQGEHMPILIATSDDSGASWSEPTVVAATGIHALPWAAARENGTLALGWYGSWNATGDPQEADDSTEWNALLAVSNDGGATFSFGRASATPVKVGPWCTSGAACPSDRELLDYVSLVYDADGRLHYAFARSETQGSSVTAHVQYAGLTASSE